jgi:tetratricopeptide (TPR) repeat protein
MAIKDYQNAIQRDPNHFKAYYNRAFCWDKLNEYE